MSIVDLRQKTDDELNDDLLQHKKELFNLRTQLSLGQLTNTSRFKVVKKTIARIQTLKNERANTQVDKE